jgi:hypothetical protein
VGVVWASLLEPAYLTPATDVSDSLGRAGAGAARMLPFDFVALAADFACFILLLDTWGTGRPGWWGVITSLLWLPSTAVHALISVAHFILAT